MKLSKKGFAIYLTFVVTSVLLLLVLGAHEFVRFSLDMGRSTALETIAFHAADGGLERGLARLHKKSENFKFVYESKLNSNRKLKTEVEARCIDSGTYSLISSTIVFEGNKEAARRSLTRNGISVKDNNLLCGRFEEVEQ